MQKEAGTGPCKIRGPVWALALMPWSNKRFYSPKKQTTMTTFTSGRGGGHQQPTASTERAAARRRKALAHQSATDYHPASEEGFLPPSWKHVAKATPSKVKAIQTNSSRQGNIYESLSDP